MGTHFLGGLNMRPVAIADGTTYTVLAKNSGKLHVLPDVTADITVTLPPAENGLKYEFMYNGAAADAHAHLFATADTTELYAGGVVHLDHNAGSGGIEVVAVYADFSNDDLLTVDLPEVGTQITFTSNGTSWYVNGTVVSDTAPVFA